ncbi:MAG: hypothetical protein ACR2JJ_02185 [Sphingomicrobium sp.]
MRIWTILAGAGLVSLAAVIGRGASQRAAMKTMRERFPKAARQRLVASFPQLDPIVDERPFVEMFDWVFVEMFRRTGTRDLDELTRWSLGRETETFDRLADQVICEAVARLPARVLEVVDTSGCRQFASFKIQVALADCGPIAAELEAQQA